MEFNNEVKKELRERLKTYLRIEYPHMHPHIFEEIYFCAKQYFNCYLGLIDKQTAEGFVNGYCLCLENRAYITTPERIQILGAIFEVCENLLNGKKD